MSTAIAVVSIVLAVALAVSAINKLSHRDAVVQTYAKLGVAEERLNLLAILLLAGAAGLVVGIWWPAIGIAAAIALVLYFLSAVLVHLRANDARNLPTPLVLGVLAAVTLILRWVA